MPALRSASKSHRSTQNQQQSPTARKRTISDRDEHDNDSDFATALADTIKHSQTIIEDTEGVSKQSIFQLKQPAPLHKSSSRKFSSRSIEVVHVECISSWIVNLLGRHPKYKDEVVLANSASAIFPGGIPDGDTLEKLNQPTQEQILCATSTLHTTLTTHQSEYPWPAFECPPPGPRSRNHKFVTTPTIFSPTVTIFKTGSRDGFVRLPAEQWTTVAVISISPPRSVHEDNIDAIIELGHKIITIFRLAAMHGKKILVLDGFGLSNDLTPEPLQGGTESSAEPVHYNNNNPKDVAELLLHISQNDPEFAGRFEQIYLLSNSEAVCDIFRAVFVIDELGVSLEVC